jgi:hypothetical protein
MKSIAELRSIASEICSKYGTLCFTDMDPDKLVLFSLTWVESFYYVDPVACSKNPECVRTIFEMHSTVYKLALENKYIVQINKRLLERAVRRLLALSEKRRSLHE